MSAIERLGRDDPEADPDPEYLTVDDAGQKLDALSSATAREIVVSLSAEPATPSELATRTDTSLQNVGYHLSKLEDAGLVSVLDTRYSEKGREMNVYGPAVSALVIGGSSEPREEA